LAVNTFSVVKEGASAAAGELTVFLTKNGRFWAKLVTMLYAAWFG
jgi:hypothetical protein